MTPSDSEPRDMRDSRTTRDPHAAHDGRDHHEPEDLGFPLPPPAKASRTGVVVVLALVVGGGLAFGWVQRSKAQSRVGRPVAENRVLRVEVITPGTLESDRELAMPGTVRSLEQTRIYPRVTGYVKRWLVDIGDKVTEGQLLAEIETPELDAQLAQARAQLAQAQAAVKQVVAQRDYSKSNTARFSSLADQQLVSKQQVEQTQAQASTDEASVASAQSNVIAQQANVRRLVETQGFARVVAPFAGKVTTRSIERGDLVSEAKTAPLYTIETMDPVRVLVEVPQTVAATVRAGTDATLTVREYRGRTFAGKVTRSAGALDPELRTMTTEVQVPNPDGALLSGMYVRVTLALSVPHRVIEIPATALYSDSKGLRVAVVDAQQKVHYVPITIERDTGSTLHVATGLTGDERMVKIAVPGLVEGDLVEVAAPRAAPAGPAGSAAPTGAAAGSAAAQK